MRTEWSRRRRSEAYTEFRLRGAGLQCDFSVTFHGRHHSGTQRPLPYFNLTSGFLDCVRKNSRLVLHTSSHPVQGHNATGFEPLPIVDELEAATFFPSFSSSYSWSSSSWPKHSPAERYYYLSVRFLLISRGFGGLPACHRLMSTALQLLSSS